MPSTEELKALRARPRSEALVPRPEEPRESPPDPPLAREAEEPSALLKSGDRIGKYRIEKLIGHGGMGFVYLAKVPGVEADFALKTLTASLEEQQEAVDRFQREVTALTRVAHPNIVKLHDCGFDKGVHYHVMDFVDGEDLEALLSREGRLAPRAAAKLIARCARALAVAHDSGIVHRDVNPSNILIDKAGEPVLTDFGLVRLNDQRSLTAEGSLIGTLAYMSPEQAEGERAKPAADIYSLGATLYRATLGRKPYESPHAHGLLLQLLGEAPDPPRTLDPEFPLDLQGIIGRAMARAPGDRYGSAGDMADDLEAFAKGDAVAAVGAPLWANGLVRSRTARGLVAALVAVCLGSIPIFLAPRERPGEEGPTAPAIEALAPTPMLDSRIGPSVLVSGEARQEARAFEAALAQSLAELLARVEGERVGPEAKAVAQGRYEEAAAAWRGGDVEAAMGRLDECFAAFEGHIEARYLRAELRAGLGETRGAIKDLSSLIARAELGSRDRALLRRSRAYADLGEGWSDVLAERDLSAVSGGGAWRARHERVVQHIARGRLERALSELELLLSQIDQRQRLTRDELARLNFDYAQLHCKLGRSARLARQAARTAASVAKNEELLAAIRELLQELG